MKQNLIVVMLVVAVLVTACGGAPAPAGTAQPAKTAAPAQPTAAPTTAPTAAPTTAPTAAPTMTPTLAPTQAAASVPTATRPPAPTVAPTPAQGGIQVTSSRSVQVSALWYGTDANGRPTGGTSTVRITAEPNASKQFRVGFYEGEVAGSGPMWRASGWVATIMAALLTGFDPAQTQVSFDVAGRIDGPSAGGLMTVGVLAALRGDKIRDDAAMTGTINPDGTIGPVGGVPYKIDGAAKAGKKLVLIPVGRMEGGVDLVERGRRQNVDVREVSDVYMAYEGLTGKSLPKPPTAARPQVTGAIYDRMNAKFKEWIARYQEAQGQYNALPDAVKQDWLQAYMDAAAASAGRATRLAGQSMIGGAYGEAVNAASRAVIAAQTGRILELYTTQGTKGALKQLSANASFDTKVAAVADRLKAEQPSTIAGASALTMAYGSLIEALGLADAASTVLARPASSEDEALTQITTASLYLRMADLKVEVAKDILDMASALGGTPLPATAPVASVADFFRRAAEANLNLFDTVVLEPLARSAGMNLDTAKARFGGRDFTYAQTQSSLLVMPRALDRYFGGGAASAYAQLGGALSAYSASSGLIAKYYSLDAQLDDNLDITAFGKERALLDTLDLADEQARGSIAFLRSNGVDPALFIVSYESARLSREGDVSEKMDALTGFWDVYIYSRALAYLGGFAGK